MSTLTKPQALLKVQIAETIELLYEQGEVAARLEPDNEEWLDAIVSATSTRINQLTLPRPPQHIIDLSIYYAIQEAEKAEYALIGATA